MIHDCEQKENISALRSDVADLSVEISATKDMMARMDKTLALMELRLTTMTDFLAQDRAKYEKHLDEGKSWRFGVFLALLGMVSTFAYAFVSFGVLTEKVINAEKYIDSRTFGKVSNVQDTKKA